MYLLRISAFIFLVTSVFFKPCLSLPHVICINQICHLRNPELLGFFSIPRIKTQLRLRLRLQQNEQTFCFISESIMTRRRSFQDYRRRHGPETRSNLFVLASGKIQGVMECFKDDYRRRIRQATLELKLLQGVSLQLTCKKAMVLLNRRQWEWNESS